MSGAICATAGGGLLVAGVADLHSPLDTGTLAIAHLWLVGWLTLTAVGVLLQFLPVTAGVTLLSVRLGWTHLVLHVVGVVSLATVFVTRPDSRLAPVAGGVLWTGLVLAAVNLGTTLLRNRTVTVWRLAVLIALAHLVVTPTAGWLLLSFLGKAFVVRHQLALLVLHAHLGLAGWLFGLVVAVGGRLLPMFLVAPEPRRWQVVVTISLIQAGLVALGVAVAIREWTLVGAGLLAGAALWWLGVMAMCFRGRKKPSPGVPLGTAWTGLALIGLVAGAGLAAWARPGVEGWAAYGWLAIAAGGLMANGLLYRIVPFLVRLHRFRRLPGEPTVPPLDQVLSRVPHRAQIAVLAIGFGLGFFGYVWPSPVLDAAARLLVAAGTAALAGNLLMLVLGPPRWRVLFERRREKLVATRSDQGHERRGWAEDGRLFDARPILLRGERPSGGTRATGWGAARWRREQR